MNGSYAYTTELWPALIAFVLSISLGVYSWRRRHIPAARPFAVAAFFCGFWTAGLILELSAAEFATQVFWVKFQNVWQLPVAAVMTCFVLEYAGLGRWLTRRVYVLLFLVPLVSVLFTVTNDFHHLIWTGFRLDRYVVPSHGRLYWVFNSYVFLLGLVNLVVLIRLAVTSPGYRLPVTIMVVGQMIARIGYTIDKLDMNQIGPGESALLTIGVVGLAYAVAFFRFHAIDPVAAARDAALRQMREGFVVLDLEGRIIDANPMAAAMLGISEKELPGKRFKDIAAIDVAAVAYLASNEAAESETTLGEGPLSRQYKLNMTALRGRSDEPIGYLILMHDVTEQKRAQARNVEQQKALAALQERERLAGEIHDGISQTLGYVIMQTQSALKWLHDGKAEKAGPLLERLVQVTRDAHADVRESIFSLKIQKDQEKSFIPALKGHLDRFQANYGIRTELLLSGGIDDTTFDPGTGTQLLGAIQEGLTNAGKHSGASNLTVRSKFDRGTARISIIDDGQGFDAGRFKRGVDGHFGLGFIQQRMAQIGGSVRIVSEPGAGTTLTLAVPVQTHGKDEK
ncbi:MAG TPA: histidine kinase N-terminal 7TM domain-containing protein [Desulfotignum sp.]|nr:histidine kinase N-terminal 7TM domain-containing protein [Desulfotignum sp.]